MTINLNLIGRYASANGAEIPAFDSISQRLFVVAGDVVEILDLANVNTPNKIGDLALDTSAVNDGFELVPNSAAVGKNGTVSEGIVAIGAAIIETATGNHARGEVQFFNASTGAFLGKQTVGFLPDMVTFTPDGTKVLTANEGEPNEDYTFDPVGSISIINLSNEVANATVQEATFTAFNSQIEQLRAEGVRIFGPDATVAEDVEPEYITFSGDGTKAWVTLQENNAVAIVDIATATVQAIKPLGFKDHSLEGNGLDTSDRDDVIDIKNHPVFGIYLPDAIASYTVNGETYYVTANEGDARVRPTGDGIIDGFDEGDIYNEEIRVGNNGYILDPTAFPNAIELKQNSNLGRLTVTNTLGDTDGDGDFDKIYAFGSRSFSIWDSEGNLVFDSGDDFERITAQAFPDYFNASNSNNNFDDRSDNKGPEPEGVTLGKINGQTYAFVGLERIGGVMVYNVSNPETPEFVQYINPRDFEQDPETNLTDSGPEGLTFISANDSPNGKPLLVVSNETSNTINVFEIDTGFTPPNQPAQMQGLETFEVQPVFTVGEIVGNANEEYYVPPGILDGLGAFALDDDTIRVLANHELSSEVGYAYTLANGTQLTGGRVSFFDINKQTRELEDAGLAYDTIINRAGEVVDEASDLEFMGLDRLCSAQYIIANQFGNNRGLVDGLFFTGEETDGGTEFVLDPVTNTLYAVPWMGRAAWESVTQLDTGTTDKVALLIGDDRGGAPLLLYIGEKGQGEGTDILVRNGLAQGKLYVWVADSGETTPEEFNGTFEGRSGSFVEIDYYRPDLANTEGYDSQGFATQEKQDALAEEVGAFKFSRPEDLATSPNDGTVAVLASTGRDSLFPSDSWGTTYEIDVDFSNLDSITAQVDVLYDGDDAGNGQFAGPDFGLRSPDNLEWATNGLIYIQEDKSFNQFGFTSGEEASIWELNPETGVLTRIAQMDRTAVPEGQTDSSPNEIGNWESSGIIDVSTLFDETPGSLFLFDVQAHSLREGVIEREGLVQGGQLSFLENTNPNTVETLLNDPLTRFQNSDRPGTYIYAGEAESQNIRQNFPQFKEEGFAFNVSLEADDQLMRFNRFQNMSVPGTYLYAGDAESQNIRQNFPQFKEEGVAFYALDGNANLGTDIYRLQNTSQLGTYIFVAEEEKNSILANFPQFTLEGVAFEVLV